MKDDQVKPDTDTQVSNEHAIREEKVAKLQEQGLLAWPAYKQVNATCKDVVDEFQEGVESRQYEIAGRIITMRLHGKTAFATIQDRSGRVQVYIRQDAVGQEKFELLKQLIDAGDIVWFTGSSFKTKMGEITLKVHNFALLSKCLHPLPEKFHGLADIETI